MKRKVEKTVRGKAPYGLKLFTNNDFELHYELEIPKDHWAIGVLKVEKKLKKQGLNRIDKLWDELPVDTKSMRFIESRMLKEVLPSVLDKERPIYQSRKGKTLFFSSSKMISLVIVNGKKKPHHIAKMHIKGIWHDE